MPAVAIEPLFFPSRQSSRLDVLDVEEATGRPRLTAAEAFGSESHTGLLCAGDPVNRVDPYGLTSSNSIFRPEHKGPGEVNFPSGQGISTQGFWTRTDGLPTGDISNGASGGGGSGPDTTNQGGGGGRGGGLSMAYMVTLPRLVVTPQGSYFNTLPSEYYTGSGIAGAFRPGQISMGVSRTSGSSLPPVLAAIANFGRDHLSGDININFPAAGGNLGVNSTGVYLNGLAGPGGVGEASATINLNFGNNPSGVVFGGSGAIGHHVLGRFSAGWSSGTQVFGGTSSGGFYLSFGAGYGHAAYLGGGVGTGGYIYTWDPND